MEKLLKDSGLDSNKYVKTPEQVKEERWYEQVTNPRTGTYFQWSDLKQVGIEPFNDDVAKRKYPIKVVNSIYRVQSPDGREWLRSRQTWTGLDRMGNEVSKAMDDTEVWINPKPRFEMRPSNPNDRWSKMERKLVGLETEVKEHDKPFTPKNLEELYALVPGVGTSKNKVVSMVVVKVDSSGERNGNPYGIPKYEDFRNREFDELYDYAATPRRPEDTAMGKEQLEMKVKPYG
jgi:hypothetical protein